MSNELEQLGLSAKVREALVAAGLDSVEKLTEYEIDNSFTAIAGIGEAGEQEIKTALAAAGVDEETDGGDNDDETGVEYGDAEIDAKGEPLLDPEEPGISPGEKGRRNERIQRHKMRKEIADEMGVDLPVADAVTASGYIAAKKTSFIRGGETYSPAGNKNGKTEIARVELLGECDANYLADSIAAGVAQAIDESTIEIDDETGERTSPGRYTIRLIGARRVGNYDRPNNHAIARVEVPNYRIPVTDILGGLLRHQTVAFFEDKKRKK